MRKFLICLLTLLSICALAVAEMPYESVRVQFEDGFALSLPANWVCYDLPDGLADAGYRYCLGSSDASQLLYIQLWPTDCADISALRSELEQRSEIVIRALSENTSGTPFLTYNFVGSDCSGCITLLDGVVLNLLFTPQSDADLMLIAAATMQQAELAGNR